MLHITLPPETIPRQFVVNYVSAGLVQVFPSRNNLSDLAAELNGIFMGRRERQKSKHSQSNG